MIQIGKKTTSNSISKSVSVSLHIWLYISVSELDSN